MDKATTNHNESIPSPAPRQGREGQSPLSRRPTARRLVTIFRGPSNTGKTHLALSMAEAGIGRICVFDTEDKTRNVIGVNERFDAIESDPDTLLEDIQWAINEKDEDGNHVYGGLVLDSWNGYFDTLYGRAIELAEQQRGEGAKLTTNEVDVLQTKAKKVLDLLCRVSRRWVALTEHAVPQGQELDENEAGQLIIMTIGGTDYYSDVTFNLSLVLGEDFRAKRIAIVSKTNVEHLYHLGRKIDGLTFKQLVEEVNAQAPIKQAEVHAPPLQAANAESDEPVLALDDLLRKADEYGIAEVHMSKAAARYCKGKRLDQLDAAEIASLYSRLIASREGGASDPEQGQVAPEDSTHRSQALTERHLPSNLQDELYNVKGDKSSTHGPTGDVSPMLTASATKQSNGRVRG